MTRLKDLYEYLDYLDNCSDDQFLKFLDAMEKRGYQFVSQYVHDYDYPHVTHCEDCKHCETMTIFGKTILYSCTRKNPAVDVLPSDYCSRGRRKDES